MTTWNQLTKIDKLALIQRVSAKRITAERYWAKANADKKAKPVRAKKPATKLTFKSPEAQALFDSLPPEMKKLFGKKAS
jgi:hypothetical protein